jgi:hypothetical protein
MTTIEKNKRIIQAIAETEVMLSRATRYSPEFRDMKLIQFCEQHLIKLAAMLTAA